MILSGVIIIKYLIIEELMGGCAWILDEYETEEELSANFNDESSRRGIRKYLVTEKDFEEEMNKGTLQYI